MPTYIVCLKKRNNPRMDVRICETKCNMKDECREFKAHPKAEPVAAAGHQGGEPAGLKAA